MSHIAVRAEQLGKIYRIGSKPGGYNTLRDTLADIIVAPFHRVRSMLSRSDVHHSTGENSIWALKDLTVEIKRGEVIGIIGRNGAGKSTLLKILSRITEPTTGFAEIQGRVGSLLEVGTGFHPELTGRENIYLNGAILGMKRAEINHKFDEIVAFAEVEKFIDTPVKHYSTGMYLRLAFAVAAHLEPEVLLVDEVLAVGDAVFQKKCLGKMGDVAKEGRTVVFVSHNMAAITQLCQRALWLENGQLGRVGVPAELIASYLLSGTVTCSNWIHPSPPSGSLEVQVISARILSENNEPSSVVEFGRKVNVEILYRIIQPTRNLSILCRLTDSQGNVVWTSWDTDSTDWKGRVREPGVYLSRCKIPLASTRPGRYLVSIGSLVHNVKVLSYHESVLTFDVSEVGYPFNPDRRGVITPLLEWEVIRERDFLSFAESNVSELV